MKGKHRPAEQRTKFLSEAAKGQKSISQICKEMKVPLGTGHGWIHKSKNGKGKQDYKVSKTTSTDAKPRSLRKLPQISDAIELLRFHRDDAMAGGRNLTKRELAAMTALAELESL